MAIVAKTVTFNPTFGSTGTLIEYKKYGDLTWTVPSTPANPTTTNSYPLSLEEGATYYIALSSVGTNCSAGKIIRAITIPFNTTTTTTTSSTTTTTTTGAPIPVQEIVNLGTPNGIVFNPNNSLLYYIDFDTIGALSITDGGVGYFNPLTATSISDITYPASARNKMLEHMAFHADTNKLFIHGRKSGGMVIYSCTTNSVETTIAYGTNGSGVTSRQKVYAIGNKIYGGYASINGFVVVDPFSNTQLPDFIPPNTGSFTTFRMLSVGTELWLFETSSSTTPSRVLVYDQNDTSTPLATINNIDNTTAVNGNYEVSDAVYYDQSTHKVWFVSYGGLKITAIDVISRSIAHNTTIPSEGKAMALMNPIYRKSSDTLYVSGALSDSFSDPGLKRIYQIDKTNGNIIATFTTFSIGNLTYCPLNNSNYAVVGGLASYNVPNTGYDTDGKIITYN